MPGPMPPQGGGAPEPDADNGGGSVVEVLQQTDAQLFKIAQATAKSPGIPDEAKQAFQDASQAFRQGLAALGGGGEGNAPAGGATTPEQGASGAVPMQPGGGR